MSLPADTSRQPKGIKTGGQFAASTRAEADVSLTEPDEDVWPGSEFPREWPRMVGSDRKRGTVRTTNGGEVTGMLSSYGTTYSIDVETDEGRYIPIMSWRIAGVRLEDEATPLDPEPGEDLASAVADYRMHRAAARTAIDAYSEALQTPYASASKKKHTERMAERAHSLDLATLATSESLNSLRPHLNQDERMWVDLLEAAAKDPATPPDMKIERLQSTISTINVGRLDSEVLRRRALDPDDQVFGSDRPQAARYARHELEQAQAAYDAAGGGWAASPAVTERLNRAKRSRSHYWGYED